MEIENDDEKLKRLPGINSECFLCGRIITYIDIKKKNNPPVTVDNIPGYVHRRCRGELTSGLINGATNFENLQDEENKLIGEKNDF